MDRDSQLMIPYTVGGRSQQTAREFMFDLAGRLATRIHKTLRMAPTLAANLAASPWVVDDIVALVETAEDAAPKKCGPDKPCAEKIFQTDAWPRSGARLFVARS